MWLPVTLKVGRLSAAVTRRLDRWLFNDITRLIVLLNQWREFLFRNSFCILVINNAEEVIWDRFFCKRQTTEELRPWEWKLMQNYHYLQTWRRNTRFRKNWQRSRRNVMRRFGRFLKENPINLLLSWDHVPQTMKILCAIMWIVLQKWTRRYQTDWWSFLVFIQTNHVQQEKDIRECSISRIRIRLQTFLRVSLQSAECISARSKRQDWHPQTRCFIRRTEAILTISFLMRQSVPVR